MTFDKDELYNKAIKVIKENRLVFIEDIVAYLPCSKTTFYDKFPHGSEYHKNMVDLLEQNRVELKVSMRNRWYKSDNPTLQMGLYKILANDDELSRLSVDRKTTTQNDTKEFVVKIYDKDDESI